MSVLGHFTERFVTEAENLATKALAYMVPQYPRRSEALTRVRAHPARTADLSHAGLREDFATADVTAPDATGEPLPVEAKVWARLTENQPVTYPRRLPADPGRLFCITPEAPRELLWSQLIRQLEAAGFGVRSDGLGTVHVVDGRTAAPVEPRSEELVV